MEQRCEFFPKDKKGCLFVLAWVCECVFACICLGLRGCARARACACVWACVNE